MGHQSILYRKDWHGSSWQINIAIRIWKTYRAKAVAISVGEMSEMVGAILGEPPKMVLDPHPFIIYINDIRENTTIIILLFAMQEHNWIQIL